jgi:beta-lactamase class A
MTWLSALLLAVMAALPAGPGRAAAAEALIPPLKLPEGQWRPLSQVQDRGLQGKLERALKQNDRWRALIARKDLAVALVDLAAPPAPRYAQVNGDVMMRTASLPKLAILLAAYHSFENRDLQETPEIRSDLIDMIKWSSNPASNRLIDRMGLGKIDALMLSDRYRFYDPAKGGGIWLGGGYPPTLERPDPVKGIIHGATAGQVCRFYYLLAYGRLVSPEASRQMLKILAYPLLDDKFVSVLGKSVPPNRLYRKSGTFKIWHSDSVLVWGEGRQRYILVALVQNEQGEQILKDLVPGVEKLLGLK